MDWLSDAKTLRKYFQEQNQITQKINQKMRLKALNNTRKREKHSRGYIRIKAKREERARQRAKEAAQRAEDAANFYGPTGATLVGGPDVTGLSRRPKDRDDLDESTTTN